MGTFKIEITAIGGHGVDRDKKNGEIVDFYKEGSGTPDALAKTFSEVLRYHGMTPDEAIIRHWPGEKDEVVDDLLTGKRKGNF